jgi:hypothetical protein
LRVGISAEGKEWEYAQIRRDIITVVSCFLSLLPQQYVGQGIQGLKATLCASGIDHD